MEPLVPLALAHGWAAGVNAYLTVALFGLSGRLGLTEAPAVLERTEVLVIAFVLAAVEFVVDKIPFLDSTWDAVHTAIRPAIGAWLGVEIAGDMTGTDQALAGTGSGLAALASHAVKASLRLAVNSSPEPASNIAASLAEDGAVSGVVFLATEHPWIALSVSAALLVAGATLAIFLLRRIRRGLRRLVETRGPEGGG